MFSSLELKLVDIKDDISIFGRTCFGEDGALDLSWSASGFGLRFVGSGIAVRFLPHDPAECVSVKIEVDGVGHKSCVFYGNEPVFVDGLEDTEHVMRFYKASEGNVLLQVDAVRIIGTSPSLLHYAPDYKFKMEVIGDSITAGFGVYGAEKGPYQLFEQDATVTYAHLAAEALSAEVRILAYSGRGIARSSAGENNNRFIDMFRRTSRKASSPPYSFGSWTPDVLVINGGTNDAASGILTDKEFYDAFIELYDFARKTYPDTKILFLYGAMGLALDKNFGEIIGELSKKDKNVFYLSLAPADSELSEKGTGAHPSYIAHKRFAEALIGKLREIL
jgi:lysophospholipase L1-like esterase